MPDDIDRDQQFNEQQLEEIIRQNRFRPAATPSLLNCRLCGEPIAEKRRQALPGVTTCAECQTRLERHQR